MTRFKQRFLKQVWNPKWEGQGVKDCKFKAHWQMWHRKCSETKQQPSRVRSSHWVSCCLVSPTSCVTSSCHDIIKGVFICLVEPHCTVAGGERDIGAHRMLSVKVMRGRSDIGVEWREGGRGGHVLSASFSPLFSGGTSMYDIHTILRFTSVVWSGI